MTFVACILVMGEIFLIYVGGKFFSLMRNNLTESLKQTQNVNNAKLTHHQTTEEVKRVNEQVMKLLESYQGLVDNINNQFDDLNNRVRRLERSLADQQ